jgi:heme/copper-type cytochrome/quinol oxidase subunit 4
MKIAAAIWLSIAGLTLLYFIYLGSTKEGWIEFGKIMGIAAIIWITIMSISIVLS